MFYIKAEFNNIKYFFLFRFDIKQMCPKATDEK